MYVSGRLFHTLFQAHHKSILEFYQKAIRLAAIIFKNVKPMVLAPIAKTDLIIRLQCVVFYTYCKERLPFTQEVHIPHYTFIGPYGLMSKLLSELAIRTTSTALLQTSV